MAKETESTKLVLRMEKGLDNNGKMTYNNVSFNRVVEAASDEAVHASGQALASLLSEKLAAVIRVDNQKLNV